MNMKKNPVHTLADDLEEAVTCVLPQLLEGEEVEEEVHPLLRPGQIPWSGGATTAPRGKYLGEEKAKVPAHWRRRDLLDPEEEEGPPSWDGGVLPFIPESEEFAFAFNHMWTRPSRKQTRC